MLFFNFLCLLYLMVLSNSHTISKSIDTHGAIDEVSDTIIDLEDSRPHRIRRDRLHQKFRIRDVPTRQRHVVAGADTDSKTAAGRPYTDIITVTTANPTYRSPKRKIDGFWRRFKAKNKKKPDIENAQRRHVAKYQNYEQDNNENIGNNFNSFIFRQPAIVKADDDVEVTVDVPIKKKHNNVKFILTPYIMYAPRIAPSLQSLMDRSSTKKTTENMYTALAKMSTQINHLKKMYGVKKSLASTETTTYAYPRTADIEQLLTGIKMKALQTVVENSPSLVDIISNTVTEATYAAEHLSNRMNTPFSRFLMSTLRVDNIFNREMNGDFGGHNLVTRSVTSEPLSLANIEEILEKEIKNIYHKMKIKVTKEVPSCKFSTPPSTTPTTSTTTTPGSTNTSTAPANATKTILSPSSSKKPTPKNTFKPKMKPSNQEEVPQYTIKSSPKPPQRHNNTNSKDEPFLISRKERNKTPTQRNNVTEAEGANTDDYSMLNLYEKMLQKVQEDNAMTMIATANLPSNIQNNDRYRLSKRNPETLTDIELKETLQKLYNDGVIMPDYEYLKTLSTPTGIEDDDKGYELKPSTSYEDLSKKIAYDDFVNGYKHYLKFQQDKAKADNFSAMVKYQAHRHHNVDDIGKYILNKIPQLPQESTVPDFQRLKRFFEDMDMEDQEVSTKTDDSWFRKHFYIFLDYGPPKKFHTSQIVALKPPTAHMNSGLVQTTKMVTYNQSSNQNNQFIGFESFKSTSDLTKKSSSSMNLDELTKSLDAFKSTSLKNSINEIETINKDMESTTKDLMGYGTLPIKMLEKVANNKRKRQSNEYTEITTEPMNPTLTYLADRYKRANISIAEDFVTKDLEERSSTPAKDMQADVTLQVKNKNGNKFGYVDVNLVPSNAISLQVNNTKGAKKSKLREFFKRFHFKSMKSKKKEKRSYTYRPPRFNPFKSLKKIIFKPTGRTTRTQTTEKKIRTRSTSNIIKTKPTPIEDNILDKAGVDKHKTTTTEKTITTSELKTPENSEGRLFSVSEALKPLPPFGALSPQPVTVPPVDTIPTSAEKLSSFDTFPSQPGKVSSLDNPSSQSVKPLETVPPQVDRESYLVTTLLSQPRTPSHRGDFSGHAVKPSTSWMIMDDGLKSVLFVQPDAIRKSTRYTKPPKRRTTVNAISSKLKSVTNDFRDIITVNIKTLRTLPSIVMKALTSIITNDTFPDLNLQIAKMQYEMPTTDLNQIAEESELSTTYGRNTDIPLEKPMIEGLSYINQLTRYAKLTLPKAKRLDGRKRKKLSDDITNTQDYDLSEYAQESNEKDRFGDKISSSQIGTGGIHKNIDYFNDLLMWNNDILNIDKVPRAKWMDLVKSVEKDLGTTEYTSPNLSTMINELKELDKKLKQPNNKSNFTDIDTDAGSRYDKNLLDQTFNAGLIRNVALNDKTLVKSKDLLIKGEQKYFQYNRPNIVHDLPSLPSPTVQFPMWSGNKPFKQALNVWTADANFTIQSPFSWSDGTPKETPQPCRPLTFSPSKHISWNYPKKPSDDAWTFQCPITWSRDDPSTKPPEDYLAKIARKFYIGSKPNSNSDTKVNRLLRLSSLKNPDLPQNNVGPEKNGKYEVSRKTAELSKAETTLKADKTEASSKTDKSTEPRKDFSAKDTPALMVDTTLLSYDDEVETVTNFIDMKKLSRNSQKAGKLSKVKFKTMTRKPTVNVVAKTHKKPQMYYSTPLPMKASDFNKFLKEQGMDVESLISPIYGQTTLFRYWPLTSTPTTICFVKTSLITLPPSSSPVTKLTDLYSKYSTRINKLRHKPKQDKIKDKKENLTVTEKSKSKMKEKLKVGANNSKGSQRYKRQIEPVIEYVLDRPYLVQSPYPLKRGKKKLFRQFYEASETTPPAPKKDSGTEETFSPELQAKLSHLQEPKRITVPKTKPQTRPRIDFKPLPTFKSQFIKTSGNILHTTETYKLTSKLTTTKTTALVSTIEPEQDDSAPNGPLQLSGSIIFSSEDSHNKDVDITIINFDDVKKNDNDFSSPTVGLPEKEDRIDYSKDTDYANDRTEKLKEQLEQLEGLPSRTVKVDQKYNDTFRFTTRVKGILGDKEQSNLLLNKKMEKLAKNTFKSYKTYENTQLPTTKLGVKQAKHQNFLYCLDPLAKHHTMLKPKKVHISSHHYRYDILYKNSDNLSSTFNQTEKSYHNQPDSCKQADCLFHKMTTKSSSLEIKNKYNKPINSKSCFKAVNEKRKQRNGKQNDRNFNRRWLTLDSWFRYGRTVDLTEGDKENELNTDYADIKTLEKRFFSLLPKIHFLQDKLSSKRMTYSEKTPASRMKDIKATKAAKNKEMHATSSIDDLYKSSKENEAKRLGAEKLTDAIEGFRIEFGRKKINDAVEKIKAMTTEEASGVKYEISSKFGFTRKNYSNDYEEIDTLRKEKYNSFKFSTNSHSTNTTDELDYQEMVRDPEHAVKTASEKAASNNFEKSIFDKSMYGKTVFDETAYEKAIFGPSTDEQAKAKSNKSYSRILTDIMSYDITQDKDTDEEYEGASLLPDHVNVDNFTFETSTGFSKKSKTKNYIFDSASIIYNKSYLHHFNAPGTKMLLYGSGTMDNTTEKTSSPVAENAFNLLFRNPFEGNLALGVKPVIQVNQPNPSGGLTLQLTPIPTPMEVMEARLSQQSEWPEISATSLSIPPLQDSFGYNSSETYGIYVEPGILNYNYNPPIAPFGREHFYADINYGTSRKNNAQHVSVRNFKPEDPTRKNNNVQYSDVSSKRLDDSEVRSTTRENPFTIFFKTYPKKPKYTSKSTNMYKNHTVRIHTTTTSYPKTKQSYVKRDVSSQDIYTAKDVAALEVIVDLMKNTLGYEEKDTGPVFSTNEVQPMKSIHQPHDSTNSIQVHIAIPYDMQNTKKRSPLEPMRIRKVFSAKMSTPVDLEYQVHSFEGSSSEALISGTTSNDDGLSPGMYLLIDTPKNGYALKPVKTNIDFAELKSRQVENVPVMDLKGETTLRHDSIKNLAKVTLSKDFISAVNRQLVEMYENLTKTNDSHRRKRRHYTQTTKMMSQEVPERMESVNKKYRFRSVIDWDAVKKYFGYERVCNCKCKANQPMCRACAASDAVIQELIFEFDNLGKYMKDHCTEIQTYFWVNPSGGLKLRNAVDRIEESLRDYYKRSKGKCKGRPCETLGTKIEKRQFVKNTKVAQPNLIENVYEDLISVADDINKITAMNTYYNDKLQTKGKEMLQNINFCISHKAFGKRSDTEPTKKKFIKNVYSLDNINVNIICNPEPSTTTEAIETTTTPTAETTSTQKIQEHPVTPDNIFEFEVDNIKNQTKRKGFGRLFLKRNNHKDKLFTYYTIQETKTTKTPFKRQVNNQIEIPLVADRGSNFWLEYLRAASTNEPETSKELMPKHEPKLDVAVLETKDFFSNNNDNAVNFKTISVIHDSVSANPILAISSPKNMETTSVNLPENLNYLLNLFENLLDSKKENHHSFSVFSQKIDLKQTAKIKSVKPSTSKEVFAVTSNKTSKAAITTFDKLKKITDAYNITKPLHTVSPKKTEKTTSLDNTTSYDKITSPDSFHPEKTSSTTNTTSSSKYWDKFTDIVPNDKTSLDTTCSANRSTDTAQKTNTSSDTTSPYKLSSDAELPSNVSSNEIPEGSLSSEPISRDTISSDLETKSTEHLVTEKTSTDAILSDISSDNIFADTFSLDTNTADDSSINFINMTPLEDMSSDVVASQDNKPNVSQYEILEGISLPSVSPDISSGSLKTKVTMSWLYSQKGSSQPTSQPKADTLRTHTTKEQYETNQKLTTVSEEITATILKLATTVSNKKKSQKTAEQKSLDKDLSPTSFIDLPSNFYLIKETSSPFGQSDVVIDKITTASKPASDVEFKNIKSQHKHPKIVIINDYDQVADSSLSTNERNSDKYRNVLLSILQYEKSRLNDEWQKVAYANNKDYGYKRSATLPYSTSWQPTLQTSLLQDNMLGKVEQTKKKGLLNKLVSKIGMKVVSAKKKVAHSSPSKYSSSKAMTDMKIDLQQTDKTTAAFSAQEKEMAGIESINNAVRRSKQKKTINSPEATHLYPSRRTVCDIQATFNHVTQRRQELEESIFEAYVKDVPCYKYKRLQRSFLITHKTRIPKWDWIRNKRSLLRIDKYKNSEKSYDQYCDKFEMFVKDDDGIYRIVDRKKRETSRSFKKQMRYLPLLKPGKNELYVMVGDSVVLDCPPQPQLTTYSQYIWGADPKDLLNSDNVRVDGFTLVIRKVGPRNAGRYSCSVDGVVRKSTKLTVISLPAVDVAFLPTYKTPRECNYDDLKAIQQLGREMSLAVGCGDICSIRIDEPVCQKDRVTNRSLIRSTGVLEMSPRPLRCSVQCRRDLFSSLVRLALANIPTLANNKVVFSKDGVNETLKPWQYVGRTMTTHTLRKKDSSGHFEYHKFSSLAEPGQMNIVTLCHPGFYLLKEYNICAPCPTNTSSSLGDNVCMPCAPGMTAAPGSAECHSVVKRLRRYDWWWYPPCGYVLAFGGLVCACGVCMVLALIVHLGSKGIEATCPCDRLSSVCLERAATTKPHVVTGYMHSSRGRPLSPSRVILARFFKPSLPSSRGTVVDSQETRFELWKEKNIPPSLPDIDFDIDTS